MSEPFFIALRESLQCCVLLSLLSGYLYSEDKGFQRGSFIGVFAALLAGFATGYFPDVSKEFISNETWTFWRYISESVIFYLGILIVGSKANPSSSTTSAGLFFLGFFLFFFESRALGFLIQDMGAMKGDAYGVLAGAVAGIVSGFIPFVLFRKRILRIPFREVFVFPSLLMVIGALLFGFGGVGELEKESVLIAFQKGLLNFLGEGVRHIQSVLLISEHPFLGTPLADLARFLAGERAAMTITILFIMVPPLFILIHLLSRPDPIVNGIQVGAQRRQRIAFFRKELIYQSAPVLAAFFLLIVLLHAVNVSFNPMYEPVPVPVREAENSGVLKIPLSERAGDLTDKKLRKYVYYYGNRQIVFLAIMKPDGSLGLAMDECEICRPADWNKDAKGYAQRGENLICKYCVTPIAIPTVNNPGGCNPIPLPFKVEEDHIVIVLNDLIDTFRKIEALEKKGTHL